jgi:hypothetical protein
MHAASQAIEAAVKPLRPDDRREITNAAYKSIVDAELAARTEKTRRLQAARKALESAIR